MYGERHIPEKEESKRRGRGVKRSDAFFEN